MRWISCCCCAAEDFGWLHVQVQDVAGIVERLLGFLEIDKPFVIAEAVIQVADLLRRFPEMAEVTISSISLISPEVRIAGAAASEHSMCIVAASSSRCTGQRCCLACAF